MLCNKSFYSFKLIEVQAGVSEKYFSKRQFSKFSFLSPGGGAGGPSPEFLDALASLKPILFRH